MLERFPGQRFLRSNFGAIGFESDAPDLMTTGKLPRELNGTLFRNGPNPMFAPRDQYHMVSGDGMVHAFKLAAGRVSCRNRWARTQKLEREIAAGHALFGTFGNPATSDPAVVGLPDHVANTHVIWHGQRLLALEEFNLPFELEPHTLASRGSFDYAGALQGPMTARPKLDPKTGELHFVGYGVGGLGSPRIAYHVADTHGHLRRTVTFDAPYAARVHDFILTEHHVLLPIFPLTISPARAASHCWRGNRPKARPSAAYRAAVTFPPCVGSKGTPVVYSIR